MKELVENYWVGVVVGFNIILTIPLLFFLWEIRYARLSTTLYSALHQPPRKKRLLIQIFAAFEVLVMYFMILCTTFVIRTALFEILLPGTPPRHISLVFDQLGDAMLYFKSKYFFVFMLPWLGLVVVSVITDLCIWWFANMRQMTEKIGKETKKE